MQGGYIILNFKEATLSSTATEIVGAFKAFHSDKPVLLYGLKLNSKVAQPFFAPAAVIDTDEVEFTVNGYVITIDEDDNVKAVAEE